MTRIQRLGTQHYGVCIGHAVLSTHVTRKAARRAQKRAYHRLAKRHVQEK